MTYFILVNWLKMEEDIGWQLGFVFGRHHHQTESDYVFWYLVRQ
jgi:hypothetical protein